MLAELIGSRLRAKILGWLFLHPDQRYFGRQLETLLQEDSTNISRELAKLETIGILTCQTQGRQKFYQANQDCPVFAELQGLVLKTAGLADVLRDALNPLSKKIKVAFVYGSFAKHSAGPSSDVDLMVIGSCSFRQVVDAIGPAQERLGREINPTVYPVNEWQEKLSGGHHFVASVADSEKIFIKGNEDDLARIAR